MIDFVNIRCCECSVSFGLHPETHRALKQSSAIFHCPFGHEQHFRRGPSEADKLRQERDRLKQQQARLENEKRELSDLWASAERRRAAARGQVTRLKNRAKAGMCPCCNRHFTNLERHMANRHPEAEPSAFAEEQWR